MEQQKIFGRVVTWKDDGPYGFLVTNDRERFMFYQSDLKTPNSPPHVGAVVSARVVEVQVRGTGRVTEVETL